METTYRIGPDVWRELTRRALIHTKCIGDQMSRDPTYRPHETWNLMSIDESIKGTPISLYKSTSTGDHSRE
jgi:hypothetical protein